MLSAAKSKSLLTRLEAGSTRIRVPPNLSLGSPILRLGWIVGALVQELTCNPPNPANPDGESVTLRFGIAFRFATRCAGVTCFVLDLAVSTKVIAQFLIVKI